MDTCLLCKSNRSQGGESPFRVLFRSFDLLMPAPWSSSWPWGFCATDWWVLQELTADATLCSPNPIGGLWMMGFHTLSCPYFHLVPRWSASTGQGTRRAENRQLKTTANLHGKSNEIKMESRKGRHWISSPVCLFLTG